MTKQTKTLNTLQIINKLVKGAKASKENYRKAIQQAIELFVKEYNGSLTFNRTPFMEICKVVGNDAVALRAYLFKWTNMTKVKADYSFETDVSEAKTDAEGNVYAVYTLQFRDGYANQKWWECAPENPLKTLTDDNFKSSVKALINRYTSDKNPANLNDANKAIIEYLKTKIA